MMLYTLDYRCDGEPCTHELELPQADLPRHEAALHLLQLHHGDAENSLVMPSADATPGEILEKAERVGLTDIKVRGALRAPQKTPTR